MAMDVDASECSVIDSFADGVLGLTQRWTLNQSPPTCETTVEDDMLVLKLSPNVRNYAWVYSKSRYDLTGSAISVRVNSVVNGDDRVETYFSLRVDAYNMYFFDYSPGALTMQAWQDATDLNKSTIPYDPDAHRYWRIQDVGGAVGFFTSPDGREWTKRHEVPSVLDIRALDVELGAGADADALLPVGSRFDDVQVCRM